MKTSRANADNSFQSRNNNQSQLMRKAIMLAVAVFSLLMMSATASVQASQRLAASLTGAQETPPTGSAGTGYGSVILSDDQTTITVNLGFTGLGTAANAAHIHTGPVGVAGGVTFPLAGTPAATSGVFAQQTFAISPAQVVDLLAGNMYFNIHSGGFPGGEIRGQIGTATCSTGQNIEVEATSGTMGPTGYASLNAAFTAINAGTHTGAINVEVCLSETEGTTPANLNSSGAGSASYTSLNIYPLADGVSISGNPVTGFGVIQLNGADNVTIDGDNPNTAGINRNLTVSNTTTATVIANSAVRIATSAAVTSADNDTIKNCVLLGNVTAGNAAAITSTAGSSNSSFGIYVGGNGGATATGAPVAITSVTANTAPTGTTINNLLINNNTVNQCARAIVFNGAVATVSTGVTISNNVIGDQGATTPAVVPPYTAPATTVYTKGIWVAGTAAVTVSGNTLRNIMSYVGTTITSIEMVSPVTNPTISNNTATNIANNGTVSIVKAILISSSTGTYSIAGNSVTNVQSLAGSSGTDGIEVTAGSPGGTIERNKIQTVYGRSAGTFGAYGLNLTAGTGIVIRNNFISDINMDMTGGLAFSTTFSVHGIRINGGTNHKVYHNSVQLFGSLLGTGTTAIMTSAFEITLTTITGVDVRNNIFSNTLTGGTTSIAHVSIFLPTNSASAMGLTLNNNDYFSGPDAARQGIAQAGTTAGTGFYLASNFNAALTTPATNLRALTTLLGPATNDNASQVVDPQFVSTSDLHILVASPMVNAGDPAVGVTTDIDGQLRVGIPDIGADEPSGTTPPANDIAATAFVVPTNGSTVPNGTSISPQASFSNVGTATQTSIGVQFTISGPGGYSYTNNQVIASLANGATTTVTFAAAPVFTTPGSYTMSAAVTTPDATPANDVINGGFTVANPLSGSYNVPGDFPSLTNNGGIFQAINSLGATSNLTINIASDLVGETGTNALNQIAGGFTTTIKPSGSARAISGSSVAGNTGLIKLNGADGVTIDGSLSGGTDRSLTITNTNAAGVVIWIATNATSGANSNTIKNSNLFGSATPFTTIAGVLAGSGTTFGGAAEFQQNNNTIQNNLINRVQNCAFLSGNAAGLDQNWVVKDNNFGSAVVAEKMGFRGMLIGGAQNMDVSNNTISGVSSSTATSSTMSGIQVSAIISGGSISRNTIKDIRQNNTAGWGSNGIYLTASSTTSNLTISNNFVSDVASFGFADVTSIDNGYGIMIDTGGGYKIYHNTVNLNTNQTAAGGITAALNIAAAVTTVGSIDLRDNILMSTQTVGTRYGVYDSSTAGATIFSNINYNDYFAQNVGFLTSARATLANWQAATGQDANSLAVDPVFASATDFHLQPTSTLLSVGTSPALVANDIDNDPRPLNPDIGADELVQATGGSFAAGTYYNASAAGGDSLGGNVTITNTLWLNGILSTGVNTLTIGCNATVNGAGPTSYIVGNLKKNYCATGVKGFEVGTANGYSPVSVNVTAGTFPADFTVKAVQGPQPNVNAATSLQRYWTLTEGGSVTANLNFNYLDPTDIAGVEANYHIIRVIGGTPSAFPNNCPAPGATQACVDFAGNQATINGVTNFSDWTLGTVASPTAAPATISGQVTTTSGAPMAGVTVRLGGARNALAITDAQGNYRFANVDTDNFYTVTPAITNHHFSPTSRSFSLLANVTDATFTGSLDSVITGNVIDTPEYFVRQHYLDFLGREPDSAGLNFWSNQIAGCGNDFNCIERRTINVSAAYFLSIEFQETGGLVDGLYRASYGRAPLFSEFIPDTATVAENVVVGATGWEAELAGNKQEFLDAWVARPAFRAAYDNLANDGYVDALITNTRVTFTDGERATLVGGLNGGTLTRAQVLQRVAENQQFLAAKRNEMFVRMQYFGYLRRDPDDSGFHFWLNKLNEFDGNFERAEMVKAFIVSGEYRDRFRP